MSGETMDMDGRQERCPLCDKVYFHVSMLQNNQVIPDICSCFHPTTMVATDASLLSLLQSMPVDQDPETQLFVKGAGLSPLALDAIRQIVREELQRHQEQGV